MKCSKSLTKKLCISWTQPSFLSNRRPNPPREWRSRMPNSAHTSSWAVVSPKRHQHPSKKKNRHQRGNPSTQPRPYGPTQAAKPTRHRQRLTAARQRLSEGGRGLLTGGGAGLGRAADLPCPIGGSATGWLFTPVSRRGGVGDAPIATPRLPPSRAGTVASAVLRSPPLLRGSPLPTLSLTHTAAQRDLTPDICLPSPPS